MLLKLNPKKLCNSCSAGGLKETVAVSIAGSLVLCNETQKYLSVVISSQDCLSFNQLLNSIISACNYHLRAFCHIRPALTFDLATAIGGAIVLSHLDYCNSLLVGASTSAGCSK